MKNQKIEKFVTERVRGAIEEAVSGCLSELNESGCEFTEIPEDLYQWIDMNAEQVLGIHATLGVSVSAAPDYPPNRDPEVDHYLEITESGKDNVATVLNDLEGDIANGGFLQLLDNKGPAFMLEVIGHLNNIGAQEAAAIVEEALDLINTYHAVLIDYEEFLSQLGEYDSRFYNLHENIPQLYLKFLQQRNGPRK